MARSTTKTTKSVPAAKSKAPTKARKMPKDGERQRSVVHEEQANSLYFAHHTISSALYLSESHQPISGPQHHPKLPTPQSQHPCGEDLGDQWEDVDIDDRFEIGPIVVPTINTDAIKHDDKNFHVEGGRAAVARRVSANLNSDDEIIVRMKQDKRPDKEIADYLKDTGRIHYNYKTIGTRWKRLRTALAKAKDKELDEGLDYWHEGDDTALLQAVDDADLVVYRLKREAEQMRWEITARKMKEIKPTTHYSQNACRDRVEVLENGTATIPPELDENPKQREAEIEEAKERHEVRVAEEELNLVMGNTNKKAAAAAQKSAYPKITRGKKAASKFIGNQTSAPAKSQPRSRTRPQAVSETDAIEGSDVEAGSEDLDTDNEKYSSVATPLMMDYEASSNPVSPKGKEVVRLDNMPTTMPQNSSYTSTSAHSTSSVPKPFTSLSVRAQIASDSISNPGMESVTSLKALEKMNRDELRQELKQRGLVREGVKKKLLETVRAARAGATNLKHSPSFSERNEVQEESAKHTKRTTSNEESLVRARQRSDSSSDLEKNNHPNKRTKLSQSNSSNPTAATAYTIDFSSQDHRESPTAGPSSEVHPNIDPSLDRTNFDTNGHANKIVSTSRSTDVPQSQFEEQIEPYNALKQSSTQDQSSTENAAAAHDPNFVMPSMESDDKADRAAQDQEHQSMTEFDRSSYEAIASGRRLFVDNMPPNSTFKSISRQFGPTFVQHVEAQHTAGNFFVDFCDSSIAANVVKKFNGMVLGGRRIAVAKAFLSTQSDDFEDTDVGAPTRTRALSSTTDGESSGPRYPLTTSEWQEMRPKVMVTHVPFSLDAGDLHRIIPDAIKCTASGYGSFDLEFADAAAAKECIRDFEGFQIEGQTIDLERTCEYYIRGWNAHCAPGSSNESNPGVSDRELLGEDDSSNGASSDAGSDSSGDSSSTPDSPHSSASN